MIFFKMAFLNLRKHPRRTFIMLCAIAIAVGIMESISGMVDGMRENFYTNMLEESGHIQILPEGKDDSLDPYSLDYYIDDYETIIKESESIPEIIEACPVIQFGALFISDGKNIALIGNGIEPDNSFNSNLTANITRGSIEGVNDGILISENTADLFGIDMGDPVILLVEDSQGSPYYLEFPVKGLFDTGSGEFDDNNVFISISSAQELLDTYGTVSYLKFKIVDKDSAESTGRQLKDLFGARSFEIKTWQQIHGNFIMMIDLFDIFIYFMNFFTIIVAAVVITNSIIMNMFERIREFGTMRAVGLRKSGLFKLITIEGLTLGLLGSILGMAVGIGVVFYFKAYGLNYGKIMESFGGTSLLYFQFTWKYAALNFISGILISLAGSVYAAFVIIRKPLIDNLTSK